jgi:hypothetical protein
LAKSSTHLLIRARSPARRRCRSGSALPATYSWRGGYSRFFFGKIEQLGAIHTPSAIARACRRVASTVRQLAHNAEHFIHVKRLAKKMPTIFLQQVAQRRDAWIAGHETDWNIGVKRANAFKRFLAIESGQLYVQQNDRDLLALIAAPIESFFTARRGPHTIALVAQAHFQQVAQGTIIVNNQNAPALVGDGGMIGAIVRRSVP